MCRPTQSSRRDSVSVFVLFEPATFLLGSFSVHFGSEVAEASQGKLQARAKQAPQRTNTDEPGLSWLLLALVELSRLDLDLHLDAFFGAKGARVSKCSARSSKARVKIASAPPTRKSQV